MDRSTSGPIKLVLVTQDAEAARTVADIASSDGAQTFSVAVSSDLEGGLLLLDGADVLLLDVGEAGEDAIQALGRAGVGRLDVPTILLASSARVGFEDAVIQQGVQDFLPKENLTPERLHHALRWAIGRHRALRELRTTSMLDELTGLHNRRAFLAAAERQVKLAERTGADLLLVFADLDGLKLVNDTWGHEEGDRALVEAADLLEETFRDSDVMGRLGGDEFVVLMVDCAPDEAEMLVGRLLRNMRVRNDQPNRRYKLSISFGLTHHRPGVPCSVDELIRRADASMYERKRERMRRPAGRTAHPDPYVSAEARAGSPLPAEVRFR